MKQLHGKKNHEPEVSLRNPMRLDDCYYAAECLCTQNLKCTLQNKIILKVNVIFDSLGCEQKMFSFLLLWHISKSHFICSQDGLKTIYFHAIPCSKGLPLQYVYMAMLPSLYKTSVFPCHTSVAFLFLVVCFLKWSQAYLSKTQYG